MEGLKHVADKFTYASLIVTVISILIYNACSNMVVFIREQLFLWLLQHNKLKFISQSFKSVIEILLFLILAYILYITL